MIRPSILQWLLMHRARKLNGYFVQTVDYWDLLVNANISEVEDAQTGGT